MVREVDASVRLRVLPLDDDRQALARMRAVFADGYPSRVVAAPIASPTSCVVSWLSSPPSGTRQTETPIA